MSLLMKYLDRLSITVAILSTVMMMLIVSYDALSRYAFNAPLPWAFELITYYLLITALYMAVSTTFARGDHINIDLFRLLMPTWLRTRLDAIWGLMAAAVFGLIAWGAWDEMLHAYSRNEFLPGYITWPAWVSYLPILVGTFILVLRLLVHSFNLAVFGEDEDLILQGEPSE